MATNEGFGRRLEERLRALGYWDRARRKPKVYDFALKHQYAPSAVYRWLKGEVPRGLTLLRLAADVDASLDSLLAGQSEKRARRRPPIAGGSDHVLEAETPTRSVQRPRGDIMLGTWDRLRGWWARPLLPQWVPA